MTKNFILAHPDLFQDGDVFTPCPECENGGPGDPRQTGDVAGFRQFMIQEYETTSAAFAQIHKRVISNYDSMNGDVARLVMDPATTKARGGVVTIDHYVDTPQKFAADLAGIAQGSGGRIVLGEFGAPIPDLNGNLTPDQQADFVGQLLAAALANPDVISLNYWTNTGSSTQLWDGAA